MSKPVTVTVTDPESGEVLGQQTISNDYIVVCAGSRYVASTQSYPGRGTAVVTIKDSSR